MLGHIFTFAILALSGIGTLAAPTPLSKTDGLSLRSNPRSSVSLVSLIDAAQSRMDQVLAQTDTSNLDPATPNNMVTTTNDVSNTLATDLQTIDPALDTLMVDNMGNKLTNNQVADKLITLLKAFETACLTAKDADSGEIANIMELTALNMDDMSDELRRVAPGVASHSALADAFKGTDRTIAEMVDSMLGPDS